MKKKPSTEPNQRLYVIGDIHGRADLLKLLMGMIEEDSENHPKKNKKLIFLGDYIDRGLASKAVIDCLLAPLAEGLNPVFLRGNHEQYLLTLLKGDTEFAQRWMSYGGIATLASYGVNVFGISASPTVGDKTEKTLHDLKEKMPNSHKSFFNDTLLSISFGDYFFVHAGARPEKPLNQQSAEDKTTIRGDFLFSNYQFESVIVHGHTISSEPEIKQNRIGIDTGAFATGKLTCLILDGTSQKFLST